MSILENNEIQYKIALVIWGNLQILRIAENPSINQATIRSKWYHRQYLISTMECKNIKLTDQETNLLCQLNKMIYKISDKLINMKCKL